MYAFSSMLECGFCGAILSRRNWHCRSDYRKVVWYCVVSIKKGKKYCSHSKGLEEKAIDGAFLVHTDSYITLILILQMNF